MNLEDRADDIKFLISDQDTKFTTALDAVFTAIGVQIIKTPVRGATRERDSREVNRQRPPRMPGPDADHQRTAPAAGPERVHRSLQPASPAPSAAARAHPQGVRINEPWPRMPRFCGGTGPSASMNMPRSHEVTKFAQHFICRHVCGRAELPFFCGTPVAPANQDSHP